MDSDAIENLVLKRDLGAAPRAIHKYFRAAPRSRERLNACCDWYRRLGLFEAAYELIGFHDLPLSPISTKTYDGMRALWGARFLNMMGANAFALRLAERLQLHTSQEFRIIGNIYLANFEYRQAQSYFEAMNACEEPFTTYSSQLGQLELADALMGQGKVSKAFELAQKVSRKADQNSLLNGIAQQVLGEYYARCEEYLLAQDHLRRASVHFANCDVSLDKAYFDKWYGYVQFQLGNNEQGLKSLGTAEKILRQPKLRVEVWLDLLRLKSQLGLLTPIEEARLYSYPEVGQGFKKQLKQIKSYNFGRSRAPMVGFLPGEEYRFRGKLQPKLSKEARLLFWVRLCHPWGLSRARAYSLLWPDQLAPFSVLDQRLDQLLHRLRNRWEVGICSRRNILYMESRSLNQVSVQWGSQHSQFLRSRQSFSVLETAGFYNISKTSAARVIEQWVSDGLVQRCGTDRQRSLFRVLPKATTLP